MVLTSKLATLNEFERVINDPDNADTLYEYIGGEIIEVPSNAYSSKIAMKIVTYIGMYLLENDIGHLSGEAGGYQIGDDRYAPDVAFISYERQPELAKEGFNPNPPELAVEVTSPTDLPRRQRIKLSNYLAAGTIVWVVDPESQTVEVHTPGKGGKLLTTHDTLTAEAVLPGFSLPVAAIFPPTADNANDQ